FRLRQHRSHPTGSIALDELMDPLARDAKLCRSLGYGQTLIHHSAGDHEILLSTRHAPSSRRDVSRMSRLTGQRSLSQTVHDVATHRSTITRVHPEKILSTM